MPWKRVTLGCWWSRIHQPRIFVLKGQLLPTKKKLNLTRRWTASASGSSTSSSASKKSLTSSSASRSSSSCSHSTTTVDTNIEKSAFHQVPSRENATVVEAVNKAAQLLSHQAILERFVHHNPFHVRQDKEFSQAIAELQELERYCPPGERVLHLTGIDPRDRELEALVDIAAVFLDRGASKWTPSFRNQGFLLFFARLETLGLAPWRKHAREAARNIVQELDQHTDPDIQHSKAMDLAATILKNNLLHMGVPPHDWDRCIMAKLLHTRGWAGMFRRLEDHPQEGPANTKVTLLEYCAVQSIFNRAAIEAVALQSGGWDPPYLSIAEWLQRAPTVRSIQSYQNVNKSSVIAFADQGQHKILELESAFEVGILTAIDSTTRMDAEAHESPDLQFIACIDDRMCSLRRHLEEGETNQVGRVETFGVPGHFGLPFKYKPLDSHFILVQAPDGTKDVHWHVEEVEDPKFPGQVEDYKSRRRLYGKWRAMWEQLSFSPLGSLVLSTLAPLTMVRLLLMGYSPTTLAAMYDKTINRKLAPKPRTDLSLRKEIEPEEAASLLAPTFKSIGMVKQFAPCVIVLGHGASSLNNPFSSAYNCGACAGNEGGANARLFAMLVNDSRIRDVLRDDHGINIPKDTQFVAIEHDTTSDRYTILDEEDVPESHLSHLAKATLLLDHSMAENALERCHRFLLADRVRTPNQALKHVYQRSVDYAEVRPELNHATNAGVVIGRRSLTRGHFLDRRMFLPSYDPLSDDDRGTQLEYVLVPSINVCSGINLEYLFSTIANDRLGAGTKAPLNVVANIGVQQGTYGDLRSGLPTQMVEMHVPVRSLFVVDAPPERIQAVLERRPELDQVIRNKWANMIARHPDTGEFYRYVDGAFQRVPPEAVIRPDRQLSQQKAWADFEPHYEHGIAVKNSEDIFYGLSTLCMLGAFCGPIMQLDELAMMNPYGAIIAGCATSLSLPVLAFSRRYLHGEHMFSRISVLSAGLLLGFNMVATAPDLHHLVAGWGLFGFTSTFLIGSYNDRPSVRNNATFAFAAYRLSDFALITALAFSGPSAIAGEHADPELVAGCLLLAALFKSSQFPLTNLFARSMEGPTPTSALGYAGLSAHAGVVLLTSTLDLWYPYDMARIALATCGTWTALYAGLLCKIHADRKGALAYATSATLGLIYTILAAGQTEVALALSLGHAAFRTVQVLAAPNAIRVSKLISADLEGPPFPKVVPDELYKAAWAFHRIDTDAHMMNLMHRMYSPMNTQLNLPPAMQWAAKGVGVTVAGIPFTPVADALDESLIHLLPTDPTLAGAIMVSHYCLSIATIRFLFLGVLDDRRFRSF